MDRNAHWKKRIKMLKEIINNLGIAKALNNNNFVGTSDCI